MTHPPCTKHCNLMVWRALFVWVWKLPELGLVSVCGMSDLQKNVVFGKHPGGRKLTNLFSTIVKRMIQMWLYSYQESTNITSDLVHSKQSKNLYSNLYPLRLNSSGLKKKGIVKPYNMFSSFVTAKTILMYFLKDIS